MPFDLAIIGGGAGGVLVAIHVLEQARPGDRIVLLEPDPQLARGVAYATTHAEHLLNVPAGRMSAFPSRPGDFVDYLRASGADADPRVAGTYAQRRHYGAYLRQRLEQARSGSAGSLQVMHARVASLEADGDGVQLQFGSAPTLHARAAVIAVGNSARPLPARGATRLPPGQLLEAWDFDAVKRITPQAQLCIAGSGLSMVDTVLSLARAGHAGPIHVLSRHALLPLPHCSHAVSGFDPGTLLQQGLRQRMRSLRVAAAAAVAQGQPWQALMECVRPQVQQLWATLSCDDQRRFLRHVARYWDVHRHRIAPQVHAQLQALIERGQLRLHRGRLETVEPAGGRMRVQARMRDGRALQLDVDHVVNATGVEMRAQLMRNPLLSALLGSGQARPGPHGIGLDTDADGALLDAHGRPNPRVLVLGSLRIGSLWESIAVPELRVQAEQVAHRLLSPALRLEPLAG